MSQSGCLSMHSMCGQLEGSARLRNLTPKLYDGAERLKTVLTT
jgi:hypothetical protein